MKSVQMCTFAFNFFLRQRIQLHIPTMKQDLPFSELHIQLQARHQRLLYTRNLLLALCLPSSLYLRFALS